MKEEHYLSCEVCGTSFDQLVEASREKVMRHEEKCLSLELGMRVEFIGKSDLSSQTNFTGKIVWLHKASPDYNLAQVCIRSDQLMYEPARPDPDKPDEQGREVLVRWAGVVRIL